MDIKAMLLPDGKVHASKVFFKISDIFNHPLRNYKVYPSVRKVKDVPYMNDNDSNHTMDFYYAPIKKDGKYPVLFNIHGGGFVCGDKKYRSGFASEMAMLGYFVVNINYSLAPKAVFPTVIREAVSALNEVNNLGSKYDLDLDKIVITGDSAGGYYAAELVASMYSDELKKVLDLPEYVGKLPRALLTFCAPFDVLKCFNKNTPFNIALDVTNCVFGTDLVTPANRGEFPYPDSALNAVRNINKNWCECFIVVAEKDSFCGGQFEKIITALSESKVKYGFYVAKEKGDGHCTHLLPFKKGTPIIMAKVSEFLTSIKEEKSAK